MSVRRRGHRPGPQAAEDRAGAVGQYAEPSPAGERHSPPRVLAGLIAAAEAAVLRRESEQRLDLDVPVAGRTGQVERATVAVRGVRVAAGVMAQGAEHVERIGLQPAIPQFLDQGSRGAGDVVRRTEPTGVAVDGGESAQGTDLGAPVADLPFQGEGATEVSTASSRRPWARRLAERVGTRRPGAAATLPR